MSDILTAARDVLQTDGVVIVRGGEEIRILDETIKPDGYKLATDSERAAITAKAKDLPPPVHTVAKLTVLERLEAAGKASAAINALRANALLYEKWSAIEYVKSDNKDARELFSAIGLDPDEILKPESTPLPAIK